MQCVSRMMAKLKDMLEDVGGSTAYYANQIGCRTSALARRVGPRRGGIALGILATAIAVPLLVRYFKRRNVQIEMELDAEDIEERELERGVTQRRRRRPRRAHITPPF